MTFGQRLKQLRGAITQTKLAVDSQVSASYIHALELDAYTPSAAIVCRLATALGEDEDEMLIVAGLMPAWLREVLMNKHARLFLHELSSCTDAEWKGMYDEV